MPRVRRRRAWICMEALMRLDDRGPVGAQSAKAKGLDLHGSLDAARR